MLRVQHRPLDSQRPAVGQLVKDPPHCSATVGGEQSWDVLSDSDGWMLSIGSLPHLTDDPDRLEEQAGALAVKPDAPPGSRDVLAWEPKRDAVDRRELCAMHVAHVTVKSRFRPMPAQHLLASTVDLHLPQGAPACAFEAELETADTGEQ
jgi:hypothetical protein